MTISLAFLAPDLVRAAIEGRLPHGMGVTRLADLPAEWSRQHQMLGLPAQLPEGIQPQYARPMRSESRATLVTSIARGRRWLDELTTDTNASAASIAKREGCSARKVNMTISLAFLAPDLVRAAIEGRLPHGMGVTRLADLPSEWSRQHQMLGLPAQ